MTCPFFRGDGDEEEDGTVDVDVSVELGLKNVDPLICFLLDEEDIGDALLFEYGLTLFLGVVELVPVVDDDDDVCVYVYDCCCGGGGNCTSKSFGFVRYPMDACGLLRYGWLLTLDGDGLGVVELAYVGLVLDC